MDDWGLSSRKHVRAGGRVVRRLASVVSTVICLCTLFGLLPQPAGAAPVPDAPTPISNTPSTTQPYAACSPVVVANRAQCEAVVVPFAYSRSVPDSAKNPTNPNQAAAPLFAGHGVGGGFSPADLQQAYGAQGLSVSSQTVGIVDAYDDPNAESDLAEYRSHYGLSSCTTSNGCFKKVNESGVQGSYPAANAEWATEISLDLDMASAICPGCKILLVEASSNSFTDLGTSENTAASLGSTEISNSFAGSDCECTSYDSKYFNHPGIPMTAASGDHGYQVNYPASSPNVLAVGGTTLTPAKNFRDYAESAWSGTGSGCSAYEPKPVWQTDGSCSHKTNNDISAVADPNTPVSIYDTYSQSGWILEGGTSAASPIVASIMAFANGYNRSLGPDAFYETAKENGTGVLDDVVSGSNGSCGGTYLCTAGPGYDGPTGLGSPYGPPTAQWPKTNVLFVDANNSNTISDWTQSPTEGWQLTKLGKDYVAGESSPGAMEFNGAPVVYFSDGNDNREMSSWTWYPAEGWTLQNFFQDAIASGSSPSPLNASGTQKVFFVDANASNTVGDWTPSGGWHINHLGKDYVASGSSPNSIMWENTMNVYFADGNDNSEMSDWTYGGSWNLQNFFQDYIASGSSPSAVIWNGAPYVFFEDGLDNREISYWTWNSSEGYHIVRLYQDNVAPGTSPAALMINGQPHVFFVDASDGNTLAEWSWNSTEGWHVIHLGNDYVMTNSSPTAVMANGVPNVFFADGNDSGEISDYTWTSQSGWQITRLFQDKAAAGSSPSAVG